MARRLESHLLVVGRLRLERRGAADRVEADVADAGRRPPVAQRQRPAPRTHVQLALQVFKSVIKDEVSLLCILGLNRISTRCGDHNCIKQGSKASTEFTFVGVGRAP